MNMGRVKLLDCTLRDGGYVNGWKFGFDEIRDVLHKILDTRVDIVEAGFIRDVVYDKDVAVFPSLNILDDIVMSKKINKNISELAVMAEISQPIPLENIAFAEETNVDIIRVIVWKNRRDEDGKLLDTLQESFEYCKGIVEKGYKLCVQPNRTDQYMDEEYVNMLKLFAQLNPYAIYVVDSWGTMYSSKVLHYMEIADKVLNKDIAIGFHGHNNMMQAFSTAEKIIERNFDRDVIIDASISGIGRGAGNLNLELIARYLNEECGKEYCLDMMYEVYDRYIKLLEKQYKWGSSFPYFISAMNNVNPNYAAYFSEKLTLSQMQTTYSQMEKDDAVMYTDVLAKKYIERILGE